MTEQDIADALMRVSDSNKQPGPIMSGLQSWVGDPAGDENYFSVDRTRPQSERVYIPTKRSLRTRLTQAWNTFKYGY